MIFLNPSDFTAENLQRIAGTTYDCTIVGGGTAGLTAALTLIERGKKVALLEAGPFSLFTNVSNTEVRFQPELNRGIRRRHQYEQKLPDGSAFGPNLSCLGGRGMFWTGASPRFRKHDFDGWPITYEEMIPYYEWMEQQFRVSNTYGETPLAKKIIKQINDTLPLAAIPAPFAYNDEKFQSGMLPSGISSGLSVFLRNTTAQSRRDAIDLFVNSFATEITISNGKATGVKAILNGSQAIVKSKLVIVACGGIESARLLFNSGVPDPHQRIGKGIQEHLFYRSFWDASNLYDNSAPDSATVYIPSTSQATAQFEIHAPGDYLFASDNEAQWHPQNSPKYELMLRSFAATRKTDENFATFTSATLGNATVNFSHSGFEASLKQSMQENAAAIGNALTIPLLRSSFATFGGSYHEAGGLDMGTDMKRSVTDKTGKLHTVDNIYVNDASTFPFIGATNPHLTIGALSRRQTLNIPF